MVTTPIPGSAPVRPGALAAAGRVIRSPYLLLVVAVVFWAGNAVVGRAFNAEIPPISLSFWRWTLGFAVVLPFTAREVWRRRMLIARHWKLLLLYTTLGVVGCNVLTYSALRYTTAVNSSLINSTTPIFVITLSYFLFRDPIRLRQVIGVAVSLLGVTAIVSGGDLARLSAIEINRGDLLMLISIGFWSTYTALLRWKPEGLPAMVFLTVLMGFGSLMELPLYLAELVILGPIDVTPSNVAALIYVAVFPAVLALYFWNRAVAQLGAERVSPFVHLMPVFGTLAAVLFLGERFGLHHALGIALIFTGVYLASVRAAR